MAFNEATRNNLYLRCALFGPSGCGKTMTALRIAKGIAEKMGSRFAVIDTEARSASKYADRISFDVENLTDKSIDAYLAAMDECIKAGYKVLVIDSLSHAWRELTEEVDRISQNSTNKNTFTAWGKVAPKQKQLIDAILNFPGHLIATMRSKTEWVISENRNGKLAPEKMGLAPEQGKGIEYEFDLLIEMNQHHQASVTKDRTGKFQDSVIDKPGEDFGCSLYDWLTGNARVTNSYNKVQNEETLIDKGNKIVQKIGEIITSVNGSVNLFSEKEKNELRSIIKSTRMDGEGIDELASIVKLLEEQKNERLKNSAA
ncbi:MAG TPA: ATP-binding protein [Treponemataceae bacterium]|nr:ATP-binding protein [Treponemataceae bacterium]